MAGAYTFEELLAVLKSAADPEYLRPFFEAGYGSGLEAFEALLAVMQRVDEAINRTTQALYIRPWSGQTAPPAMGQVFATLEVQFTRTHRADLPMTLGAGAVLFEEVEIDAGETGGIEVRTGRRFTLTRDLTFLPGETGPLTAHVVSMRPSFGDANIAPGKLRGIYQPGATFQNTRATVVQTPSVARLQVQPEPDVIVPEHVGQYLEFVGGANSGVVRRIVGYERADPSVPHGGVALLAGTFVGRSVSTVPAGSFVIGETVEQYDTLGPTLIARGIVLAVSTSGPPWYIIVEHNNGAFQASAGTIGPIVGVQSSATFPVEDVTDTGKLTPELETAAWRIVPWAEGMGLCIANTGVATPGAIGVLDALGAERGIDRAPNEDDDSYRKRIAEIADVVSPNAIRRIGNRIWAPWGAEICLREVGSALLPGLYCDGSPGNPLDLSRYAYDFDGLLMSGAKVGEFFDGELVVQDNGGTHTTARVTSTLVAAPIGSPVPHPGVLTLEVANVRGPGFQVGLPIVGDVSGAVFTPAAIQYGLRIEDRFKLNLNYTEFRAFFLIGVPPSSLGEFGVPFDAPHPYNAFDAAPYLVFFDGFATTAAELYRATWQSIDRARAGGVSFDLYQESIGCI